MFASSHVCERRGWGREWKRGEKLRQLLFSPTQVRVENIGEQHELQVVDVVRGDDSGGGGSMHISHSRKNVDERVQGKGYEDREATKQSVM